MRFLFVALFACGSFVHAQPVPSAVSGNGEPYSGPVIDLHAHVFFDERVAASVNPDMLATPDGFLEDVADPRLVKAAALVIAPGGEQETRELNDQLREFVSRSDGALLAVGSVHPDDGEQALKELQRLAETGFAMVKLHPNTQSFAVGSAAVREVVCKAGELGLPVMFDFSGALQSSEVGDYVTLAIQCPQTQLVLAHMGMARFDETLVVAILAKYPWYGRNIWMDISITASTYAGSPYREQFVWVLRQIGMDRILFGSDYPFYTTSAAIADVERLGLTDDELHQVFFDNARALLGLEAGNLSHSSAAGHESGARATYLANEGLMVAHGETKVLFDPLFNERFGQYRYFLSQGGLEVLRERLRPVHAVGIHVPVTVPDNAAEREEALQDADLFIRPGETREIPQR